MFTDMKHDIFDFKALKEARKSHSYMKFKRLNDIHFKKQQMLPLRDNA